MSMKHRWRRSSPSIKRATESVAKAIVASLILIAAAYVALWQCVSGETPKLTVDRTAAFIDSILAGTVAFTLLGAFTFVASVKPPEEARIDDRIAFLFSARRKESSAARQYLREQVMLLGAIVSKASITYTALDKSSDGRYVRVNCAVRMTRLTNEQPVIERIIELQMPGSGELIYEYSYDSWNRVDEEYSCGANRFVESLEVTVANRSSGTLRIRPSKGHAGRHLSFPNTVDVTVGANGSVEFRAVSPVQRATFRMQVG